MLHVGMYVQAPAAKVAKVTTVGKGDLGNPSPVAVASVPAAAPQGLRTPDALDFGRPVRIIQRMNSKHWVGCVPEFLVEVTALASLSARVAAGPRGLVS